MKWRQRADLLLVEFAAGVPTKIETVAEFASAVGVSRQTIWRDKELLERIRDALPSRERGGGTQGRIAKLEAQLALARRRYEELLAATVGMWQAMHHRGVDPVAIFSEVEPRAVIGELQKDALTRR